VRWTRDLVCVMEVGRCGYMGSAIICISELIIVRSMVSYCVSLRWTQDLAGVMEVGRCGYMSSTNWHDHHHGCPINHFLSLCIIF